MSTLLTRKIDDDVLVVYFQDARIIDETRIQTLGKELLDLVSSTGNDRIILNFKNVSFMSSAMIGKLIQFGKKCDTSDIKLRLCEINDNVEEVFSLMNLGKVFKIDKDEERSVKQLTKNGLFG